MMPGLFSRMLWLRARPRNSRMWALGLVCLLTWQGAAAETNQYILFNLRVGSDKRVMRQIWREFKATSDARVRVGVSAIFSYLQMPRERAVRSLKQFLSHAQEFDLPVVVQLDGENWWGARPDLWNWWDCRSPGYSVSNRLNVEWTSWSPNDAIKIAWRNWGRNIRVLPPPNLMSPQYRAACHAEMKALVPIVLEWWRSLPASQRDLLVGIKLGHETSIGVNAWHYPDGNRYLELPASRDPDYKLNARDLPSRGVAQIGYAAVSTAGLRTTGQITEADLAEVARRHLEDLCKLAAELGVPRDRLFSHGVGWKEDELLYQAALNTFSCPGWSFYAHAADPAMDCGVQRALKRSDAPYWAAVEWLYQGPSTLKAWTSALRATLADPRCRYLCIFNWHGVDERTEVLDAVRKLSLEKKKKEKDTFLPARNYIQKWGYKVDASGTLPYPP